MTEDTAQKLTKLVILCLVLFLFVIGYVFFTGYNGRRDLVESQRRGCERGKLDRNANASGWRIAEDARRSDGQTDVANNYAAIARGLERRSRINCKEAFPKASLIP
jgi:hypothetical protein